MTPAEAGLDFESVVNWVEERLDDDRAAQVAAAVAGGDPRVCAMVGWLRGIRAVAETLPLHEPPPIVRQRLLQHFSRWTGARAALDRPPVPVRARLLFDSRNDLALVALRAAADDGITHLAFTSDPADVVLDVRQLGDGLVRLDGQVLPADPAAATVFTVEVTAPDVTVRAIDGDALGRFGLSGVPEQATHLQLDNGEMTIVIGLDLRDRAP